MIFGKIDDFFSFYFFLTCILLKLELTEILKSGELLVWRHYYTDHDHNEFMIIIQMQ